MSTPRSNIVKLRLTDLEKQDWQKAAGGTRKLSEWIRGTCNAAAEMEREPERTVRPLRAPGMTDLMISPEAIDEALAEMPPPNAKPLIVSQAIAQATAECTRWMHHRPGVYCGACKRVIKK